MSRQSWLLPRSTCRDFPKRNDPEIIRLCKWAGLIDKSSEMEIESGADGQN
jgi:hypothetical protein